MPVSLSQKMFRQGRAAVGDPKKRVELVVLKAAVGQVREECAFSERRACLLMKSCAYAWWSWREKNRGLGNSGARTCVRNEPESGSSDPPTWVEDPEIKERVRVVPGDLRRKDVKVGAHICLCAKVDDHQSAYPHLIP
jgi:hypothetical protein